MNIENFNDDEYDWDETVINAVKFAREHITALPAKFRPRALAMLDASFQDEIQSPNNNGWQRRRYMHSPRRHQTKN